MNMKTHPASGAASAHRYNIAPSTLIFKTRCQPCRIAVRADHGKSMFSKEKRTHFRDILTSTADQQTQIHSFDQQHLRFTADCQPKTANLQRRCPLRFPYRTGRRNTTGLLEQMP